MNSSAVLAPRDPVVGASRSRRLARRLRGHWPYLVLLVAGAAYLITTALLNHRTLGTGYDLGIYDQVVWNLSHGRLFATTLVYETGGTYDHFEPILVLIAPLYWLFSDVRVLLVLQSVALALGSVPIYLYAHHRFAQFNPPGATWAGAIALLPALAYLVYPPLHAANLNDFHEVALLPPLLGMALYGMLTGRRRTLWVFLALCVLVKEDVTVTVLAFGVFIALLKPAGFRRRDGVILAGLAIAWGILVLYVLYPAMTQGMPYPFVERRYSWLGVSPEDAARGLALNPLAAVTRILQPQKLSFLFQLFAPLLFLPLLGWPVIALAIPVLIYLMLSDYPPQWSVGSYYNPPLLAVLFFATIDAIVRLAHWFQARWPGRAIVTALLGAVLAVVFVDYFVSTRSAQHRFFFPAELQPTARSNAANRLFDRIPADASVNAEFWLVPHLSHRQRIYTLLARPEQPPEYRMVELRETNEGAPIYPFAAPDTWPPVYHEYEPVATEKPFQISQLKRSITLEPLPEFKPQPQPLDLTAYTWLNEPASGEPVVVKPGDTARLMLAWRVTGKLDKRFVFFAHVLKEGGPAAANGLPDIVSQDAHEAGNGSFPTTYWQSWTWPGIVLDGQNLTIPADTPAGTYYVWVGAFDKETGDRIEMGGPGKTMRLVTSLMVQP